MGEDGDCRHHKRRRGDVIHEGGEHGPYQHDNRDGDTLISASVSSDPTRHRVAHTGRPQGGGHEEGRDHHHDHRRGETLERLLGGDISTDHQDEQNTHRGHIDREALRDEEPNHQKDKDYQSERMKTYPEQLAYHANDLLQRDIPIVKECFASLKLEPLVLDKTADDLEDGLALLWAIYSSGDLLHVDGLGAFPDIGDHPLL